MERRRVSIQNLPQWDASDEKEDEEEEEERIRTEPSKNTETQEPFMGIKARRRSSAYQQFHGDHLGIHSNHMIVKLLTKQGDKQVFFADGMLKVNRDGRMKQRIIIVTEVAIYILDHRWFSLKRRISLSAIDQLYLSELCDNFLAITVPSEYDCLLASTRKNEIVTVLVNTPRSDRHTSIQVSFANRFEYRVDSKTTRIVHFEEIQGGVKTTIVSPEAIQK